MLYQGLNLRPLMKLNINNYLIIIYFKIMFWFNCLINLWIHICFTSFIKLFSRYKLDFEPQIFTVVSDLILVIIGYFLHCFAENSWVGQDAEHYERSLLWVDAINSANDSFIQLLFKSLLLRFCSERDWRGKRDFKQP